MFLDMAQRIETSLMVPWAPRVLVTDPDEICRRALLARLQALGVAVDVAADAAEAFELCASWPYAAVFMDCGRPAVEGHRAARAIRTRDGASQHALLVAVTSYPRHACLAAGMDHHVAKPLAADDLGRDCGALGLLATAVTTSGEGWRTGPLLASGSDDEATGAEIARRFLRRTRRQQPELWRAINARDARGLTWIAGDGSHRAVAAGALAVAELFEGLLAAVRRNRFGAASAIELGLRTALVDTAMTVMPALAGHGVAKASVTAPEATAPEATAPEVPIRPRVPEPSLAA
jgi:CheY-like chemotaxis protein